MDLLFIELMSHLSHVKQMYSQPIHLTHELILHVQIHKREGYILTEIPQQRVLAGTELFECLGSISD